MAKTTKTTGKNGQSHKSSSVKKSTTTSRNASNASAKSGKEELMKLFEHSLKDIFWVEKALTRSIPKMIKKASSEELVNALEDHLEVTEGQVSKLERIFDLIDKAPRAKKCVGMEGILKEGDEIMEEFAGSTAIDAAIISAAQKVEHYEMSSYISMITLARTLDMVKEAGILEKILAEEMEADKTLTNIAVRTEHHMAMNDAG